MNIVFSVHLYLPKHSSGAEWMAHWMAKELQAKGHHVRVLLHQANTYKIKNNYVFDGVDIFPPNQNVIEGLFRWADAVFTHLDYTRWTIHMAKMFRVPVFHMIHNSHPYPEIIDAEQKQFIVYNSEWLKTLLSYKFDNFVLTPPVDYRHYDLNKDPEQNEFITLINLNKNKGGEVFGDIARAMPHKQFLGVIGSYDEQITPSLPNVKYVPNTPDIHSIYGKTRILVMPSEYESWGRTATEAMASGIPVICTPTPGLQENCGKAAIYIKDRNDVKAWVKAISELDDKTKYTEAYKKSKKRSREHDPRKALDAFAGWFKEKVYSWRYT